MMRALPLRGFRVLELKKFQGLLVEGVGIMVQAVVPGVRILLRPLFLSHPWR